jgi:hypothetical protein
MAIACQPGSEPQGEGYLLTVPMRMRKGLDVAGIAHCMQAIPHSIDIIPRTVRRRMDLRHCGTSPRSGAAVT